MGEELRRRAQRAAERAADEHDKAALGDRNQPTHRRAVALHEQAAVTQEATATAQEMAEAGEGERETARPVAGPADRDAAR
jgi:hypothetical protein